MHGGTWNHTRQRSRSAGALRFVALAVLAAILMIATAFGGTSTKSAHSAPGVSANQILLGTNVDLTGPAAYVGKGFQLGENLALRQINAHGGIRGRHVVVRYEDDAGTGAGGINASHALIQQDHVFMDVAGGDSTAMVAVAPYFENAKVPLLDSVGSDPLTFQPFKKYVFLGLTVPRPAFERGVAKVIVHKAHGTKVGLLANAGFAFCTSGVPLLTKAIANLGAKVVDTEEFPLGTENFAAQAAKLKASGANVIELCGLSGDAELFMPQLRQDGVTATFVGDATLSDPAIIQAAGAAANNMFLLWEPSKQFETATTGPMGKLKRQLAKAFGSNYKASFNQFSLFGYVDTFAAAQAIYNAGPNPTRLGVVKAFEKLHDYVPGRTVKKYVAAVKKCKTRYKGKSQSAKRSVCLKNAMNRFGALGAAFQYAVPVGLPETWGKRRRLGNTSLEMLRVRNGHVKSLGRVG